MIFQNTPIPNLLVVEPKIFGDERGFFYESFNQRKFAEGGINEIFVQDNVSRSTKGVLRGLHYQLEPNAQSKLVSVSLGAVFDVVVDLRKGSPTFGKWFGIELSEENKKMVYVPKGFAHGFQVLSDEAEFRYKVTHFYEPAADRTLLWSDKALGIEWRELDIEPILSEKDKKGKPLSEAEINFKFQPL
jgi:dTDP-4-dehydrorhamnose 3,5-epimerase